MRGAPKRGTALCGSAIAAAALAFAAPAASALTRVSGLSPFDPGCSPSTTDFVTGYEAEPSLASDPRNPLRLIAAWQQDRSSSGGDRGNLTAMSSDGGKTWQRARLPGSAACDGGSGERASDPWVSIGPDGTAYVATLNISPSRGVPSGPLVVNRSTNGGRTWRRAVTVAPDDGAFNDKEAITADPRRPGRAYLVWNKVLNPSNDHLTSLWFSRTTDGGRTWSRQREIHPPPAGKAFTCSEIVVLRDGSLLNVFSQLPVAAWSGENEKGAISYLAARSTDGGRTWGKPRRIASTAVPEPKDPETGKDIRADSAIFDAHVAGDGSVYVTTSARVNAQKRRIVVFRSRDRGGHWKAVASPSGQRKIAVLPTLASRPGGTLAVQWFDARRDVSGDAPLSFDVWLATSRDRGGHWKARRVTGRSFDLRGADPGPYLFVGDYQGLAPTKRGFGSLFVAPRPFAVDGITDVFFAPLSG